MRHDVGEALDGGLTLAIGGDDDHPGAIEVTGEELQQEERGGIRDMHVVENGNHRGFDGRDAAQPNNSIEEAEARGVRCEKRFGTGTTSERRNDLSQVVDGGTERIAKRRDPDPFDEDTEDFSPRPVRRSAARLPAPTPSDLGAGGARSGCQLGREPRLPDARLACDEKEPPATGSCIFQASVKRGTLRIAPHERIPHHRAHSTSWRPRRPKSSGRVRRGC